MSDQIDKISSVASTPKFTQPTKKLPIPIQGFDRLEWIDFSVHLILSVQALLCLYFRAVKGPEVSKKGTGSRGVLPTVTD